MSKQSDAANKFALKNVGKEVLDAAGAAGLRVLKDGEGEDGKSSVPWLDLPGSGRQLSAFAREAGQLLVEAPVYRRDKVPVTVNPEDGGLDVVTADRFRTLLEDYCVTCRSRFVVNNRATGEGQTEHDPATMPRDCANGTLAADKFMHSLRQIARVNSAPLPVVRAAGQIELLKPGYDELSQTYTLASEVRINEKLLPEEGAAMLRDYLKEFPFVDERSLAVAVAEMVALFVFGLQEVTAARMGFLYKSNKVRSGKSLVAQFGITACYGLAKGQTLSSQEETKKLLDATALQGLPYLFFDNLTGHLKSNLLESFMTTPIWTGRVFGSNSKTFDAPKGTMVIITGNNLTTSPDLAERCLLCSLHTEEADPQARTFTRIFTPQWLAKPAVRGDLLSALWALVRGWDKGRAAQARTWRRIAGFEEWSDLIGGIVTAAGFVDPLQRPKDEESTNPEQLDALELVDELAKAMPAGKLLHEFTFQVLVDICRRNECFAWKFTDGKMARGEAEDGSEDWYECGSKTSSALGRVFGTDMNAQIYTIKDGRRVRFGKRGRNRHRRYQVEILPAPPPAVVAPVAPAPPETGN